MTSGCAPPGRVWVRGRSAGRSDSCVSREPLSLAWPDNWQPRGTPYGPTSSRVCTAASDDPARFAGVRVLGVDEHVWHHQDRRRRGPRELTGIVDLTRGKDHPTARLLDLVPGRSGTVYKNWLEERGEDFRAGVRIATLDPFQGYKNAIDDQLQDTTSVLDAFHIVKLAGDALDEVRRRVQQDTTGHRGRKGDPLYPGPQSFARLAHAGSPHANKNASVRPSRQMRRISVSKSPTCSPSKSETSSIKTHPPKANAWPLVSSRAYQPVPSPRSLAWAGPYASGRTHSWPTSIPTEPATGQQKPSTESSN